VIIPKLSDNDDSHFTVTVCIMNQWWACICFMFVGYMRICIAYPYLQNIRIWLMFSCGDNLLKCIRWWPQWPIFLPRVNAFSRCTYIMHAHTFTSALCWRVYTYAHAHTVVWLSPNSTRLVTSRLDTTRHVRRVETNVSSVSSRAAPTWRTTNKL